MKKYKLNEIMFFTLGNNPSRSFDEGRDMYSLEDFDKDLHGKNKNLEKSFCIINLIKTKAAPLSEMTRGKYMSLNFLKCEINEKVLDKWYFCYQFNEGENLNRQISMSLQGTTIAVRKLNLKTISDLEIDLPKLSEQQKIGEIYRQSLLQYWSLCEMAEDIRTVMLAVLKKM